MPWWAWLAVAWLVADAVIVLGWAWWTRDRRGVRGGDTGEFFAWCSDHWAVESDPAPQLRSVR